MKWNKAGNVLTMDDGEWLVATSGTTPPQWWAVGTFNPGYGPFPTKEDAQIAICRETGALMPDGSEILRLPNGLKVGDRLEFEDGEVGTVTDEAINNNDGTGFVVRLDDGGLCNCDGGDWVREAVERAAATKALKSKQDAKPTALDETTEAAKHALDRSQVVYEMSESAVRDAKTALEFATEARDACRKVCAALDAMRGES